MINYRRAFYNEAFLLFHEMYKIQGGTRIFLLGLGEGGVGGDPEAIYSVCLILKSVL
jgi:hypothetical protein